MNTQTPETNAEVPGPDRREQMLDAAPGDANVGEPVDDWVVEDEAGDDEDGAVAVREASAEDVAEQKRVVDFDDEDGYPQSDD